MRAVGCWCCCRLDLISREGRERVVTEKRESIQNCIFMMNFAVDWFYVPLWRLHETVQIHLKKVMYRAKTKTRKNRLAMLRRKRKIQKEHAMPCMNHWMYWFTVERTDECLPSYNSTPRALCRSTSLRRSSSRHGCRPQTRELLVASSSYES